MTSRFTEVIVDSADPAKLAAFWCAVLDYHVVDDTSPWVEIAPWRSEADKPPVQAVLERPSLPTLIFVPVPDGKKAKNRMHLDLLPADRSHAEEVERVLALGAKRIDVGQGDEHRWAVMADPEGNEFCIGQLKPPAAD
ncbi:MAG TPA: VOC family protein [Streptosporangiaceae bacterium]|jgi:catechol 2,3-dioxygenase-like lactoylglutathione lyase family enzyme|nr:VOC family protein [Streptosporangiaceae bacterium]